VVGERGKLTSGVSRLVAAGEARRAAAGAAQASWVGLRTKLGQCGPCMRG
jgi:hypothetical protein